MKKKTLVMLTSLALVFCMLLSGCSGKDYDFEGNDLTPYITLPEDMLTHDYKAGLKLDTIPTDEDVEKEIKEFMEENFSEPVDLDENATVLDGDTVTMDYKGILDGETEPFEGGTSSGATLKVNIESPSYIEGFEKGLIGMKSGETKTLDLTFPDPYKSNTDLSGKAVKFEVTITKISRTEVKELTDSLVAANPEEFGEDITTVEDYRKQLKESLTEEAETANKKKIINAAWNYALEKSTIAKYPDGLLDKYIQTYTDYYEHTKAAGEGMHLKEYVKKQGYTSIEAFKEAVVKPEAEDALKQNLVLYACAKLAEVKVTDDEAKADAKEYYTQYVEPSLAFYSAYMGISDFNSFLKSYGGIDAYKESLIFDRTFEKITGTAKAE